MQEKKNGKMSFSETMQFLITGKKPEPKYAKPSEEESAEQKQNQEQENDQEKNEKNATKPATKKQEKKIKKSESFTEKIQKSVQTHTEQLVEEGLPLESDINDDERVFAGISYFPFLSFFVITTRKDSAYVMYHAWQGFAFLAVFLASLPFYFLLSFLPLMGVLFWLFYLVLFGSAFFAGFMAWSGRYVTLPFISGFAKTLSGR